MTVISVVAVVKFKPGSAQYLFVGLIGLLWMIFFCSFLPESRTTWLLKRWLVFGLLVVTLASLVLLLITCLVGGEIIGALVTFLFVTVLVRALADFLKAGRR